MVGLTPGDRTGSRRCMDGRCIYTLPTYLTHNMAIIIRSNMHLSTVMLNGEQLVRQSRQHRVPRLLQPALDALQQGLRQARCGRP